MKVVPGTRDTSKLSSSSAELACSPRLRLASLATERLAARRTIAGVVSVSIVFGPGAGVPTLSSLTTHTRAVGLYTGSRRNIARLTRLTIMAAITAMSSAPPTALATIPASTPRTPLPVFPSVIIAPIVAKAHRRGKVDSGDIHRSAWNKNSRKFAVASQPLTVTGWRIGTGLWLKTVTIVTALAAFVARNCCELSQVVTFKLRENFHCYCCAFSSPLCPAPLHKPFCACVVSCVRVHQHITPIRE